MLHGFLGVSAMKFKKQEGVAIVEFAMILPLFLLLVFGMIEFSVALYDKAMITNASREGARAAILFGQPAAQLDDIEKVVTNYLADRLISFGNSSEVDVSLTGGTSSGDERTVTVQYEYQFLVLPGFLAGLGDGITLTAQTKMRME
jgi:Flp pilus assembly protein TadG